MVRGLPKADDGARTRDPELGNPTIAVRSGLTRTISRCAVAQAVVEGGRRHKRLLPWQPRPHAAYLHRHQCGHEHDHGERDDRPPDDRKCRQCQADQDGDADEEGDPPYDEDHPRDLAPRDDRRTLHAPEFDPDPTGLPPLGNLLHLACRRPKDAV
jgi:hypothetical protein